jgi:hypothetical protein
MSSPADQTPEGRSPLPTHLNNHHRNTLRQIFTHPVSHNIEWHSVVSLLDAVGTVERYHDGKVALTLGPHTTVFDPPQGKDADVPLVSAVRKILADAGYGPEDERQS